MKLSEMDPLTRKRAQTIKKKLKQDMEKLGMKPFVLTFQLNRPVEIKNKQKLPIDLNKLIGFLETECNGDFQKTARSLREFDSWIKEWEGKGGEYFATYNLQLSPSIEIRNEQKDGYFSWQSSKLNRNYSVERLLTIIKKHGKEKKAKEIQLKYTFDKTKMEDALRKEIHQIFKEKRYICADACPVIERKLHNIIKESCVELTVENPAVKEGVK